MAPWSPRWYDAVYLIMIESRVLSEPFQFDNASGRTGRSTGGDSTIVATPRPLSHGERRRLQQAFDTASGLLRQPSPDRRKVHGLLSLCVMGDRCGTMYVLAMLDNLDQMLKAAGVTGWIAQLQTPRGGLRDALKRKEWANVVRHAVSVLDRVGPDVEALAALAETAEADDAPELAWIYWHFLASKFDNERTAIERGAQSLERLGRFDEAAQWRDRLQSAQRVTSSGLTSTLRADKHGNEGALIATSNALDAAKVVQQASAWVESAQYEKAESLLNAAMMSHGTDFRIRESWEDLQLARARHRAIEAADRCELNPTIETAELARSLDDERQRMEVRVLDARCQRYPDRIDLRIELIDRLRQTKNFPEALRQIEDLRKRIKVIDGNLPAASSIPDDLPWRLALMEGESWQSLKVFPRAMKAYRTGIDQSPPPQVENTETWLGLRYRSGVLAAAMGDDTTARRDFSAIVALRPDYKDARQRLDKLP